MQCDTIPKIIHYCWFGGEKIPEEYKSYMESWKRFCPDYEIKEWNETNYDISKNGYMEQAYKNKKWGFVPDYARLDIIYNYGGIYLDTDVELLKSLDEILDCEGFFGFESENLVNLGLGFGAVKGNEIIRDMMLQYEKMSFINHDGTLNTVASPIYTTEILKDKGLDLNGKLQVIEGSVIYPTEYFSPKNYMTGITNITDNSCSIHHFSASWLDWELKKIMEWNQKGYQKGGLYRLLIKLVSIILRIERKLRLEGIAGAAKSIKNRIR